MYLLHLSVKKQPARPLVLQQTKLWNIGSCNSCANFHKSMWIENLYFTYFVCKIFTQRLGQFGRWCLNATLYSRQIARVYRNGVSNLPQCFLVFSAHNL